MDKDYILKIAEHARSNYSISAIKEALDAVNDTLSSDTSNINHPLRKLSTFLHGELAHVRRAMDMVDEALKEEAVKRHGEQRRAKLTDAFLEKRLAKASSVLDGKTVEEIFKDKKLSKLLMSL